MSESELRQFVIEADRVMDFAWQERFDEANGLGKPMGMISAKDVRKAMIVAAIYLKNGEVSAENIEAVDKHFKKFFGNRSDNEPDFKSHRFSLN